MKSDKNNPPKVSLDDLFVLKRAERPDDAFWQDFQRDFHVRQRAEAIEPKRWWFVLPRVFAGFSRYQMPMGAAAVLAVTFLSFRDYSEPGFEVAYSSTAPAPVAVQPEADPVVVAKSNAVTEVTAAQLAELGVSEVQLMAEVATESSPSTLEISPFVVWAGPVLNPADMVPATPTPSERSIAANLATVEAQQAQIGLLLSEPKVDLAAAITQTDSLSKVSVPEPTRERLFVYQPTPEDFSVERNRESGRDTHSLIANRISQDELYESVSRLSGGGDHLTLKF